MQLIGTMHFFGRIRPLSLIRELRAQSLNRLSSYPATTFRRPDDSKAFVKHPDMAVSTTAQNQAQPFANERFNGHNPCSTFTTSRLTICPAPKVQPTISTHSSPSTAARSTLVSPSDDLAPLRSEHQIHPSPPTDKTPNDLVLALTESGQERVQSPSSGLYPGYCSNRGNFVTPPHSNSRTSVSLPDVQIAGSGSVSCSRCQEADRPTLH